MLLFALRSSRLCLPYSLLWLASRSIQLHAPSIPSEPRSLRTRALGARCKISTPRVHRDQLLLSPARYLLFYCSRFRLISLSLSLSLSQLLTSLAGRSTQLLCAIEILGRRVSPMRYFRGRSTLQLPQKRVLKRHALLAMQSSFFSCLLPHLAQAWAYIDGGILTRLGLSLDDARLSNAQPGSVLPPAASSENKLWSGRPRRISARTSTRPD